MKHMTKIFVVLAIILFIIGYYLQATGNESSGIKLLLAAIMFIICAFISRNNDRRKIIIKVINLEMNCWKQCVVYMLFFNLYILFIYNLLSSNHMYKGESYIYFTNLYIVCILIVYRRKGDINENYFEEHQ